MGIGLGALVGAVTTRAARSPYAAFIAPALLAVSAMNGAVYDSTWNVFFKMHFAKLYEGMLPPPSARWTSRSARSCWPCCAAPLYAIGFMLVMQAARPQPRRGRCSRCRPSLLIAFGFASFGMGITSYMKTFQQMDWINFIMLPMFLFSATFYPITVYPECIQWLIQAHAAVARGGAAAADQRRRPSPRRRPSMCGYYLVMIVLGLVLTTRRLRACS